MAAPDPTSNQIAEEMAAWREIAVITSGWRDRAERNAREQALDMIRRPVRRRDTEEKADV